MIKVTINGKEYSVEKGSTVLEAAKVANIDIPTLCYLKDINEIGACRLCLVEVAEMRGPALGPWRMVTACVYPCTEGMQIKTNTPKIVASRKMNLELLLSNHDKKCLSCVRSTNCELQTLCREYGAEYLTLDRAILRALPDYDRAFLSPDDGRIASSYPVGAARKIAELLAELLRRT